MPTASVLAVNRVTDNGTWRLAVLTDLATLHPSKGWPVKSGLYLPEDAPEPDRAVITWGDWHASYTHGGEPVTARHCGAFDPEA